SNLVGHSSRRRGALRMQSFHHTKTGEEKCSRGDRESGEQARKYSGGLQEMLYTSGRNRYLHGWNTDNPHPASFRAQQFAMGKRIRKVVKAVEIGRAHV